MTNFFAAVDGGVSTGVVGTGAVYGVGETAAAAIASARSDGADGDLDTVPCSDQAAMWVEENGGAPCRDLLVGSEGVIRYGESEIEDRLADAASAQSLTANQTEPKMTTPLNERVILRDSQTEADTTQIVAQYGEVAQACRRAQNAKHALTLIESLTGGGRRNAVERAAVDALCTLLASCDFAVTAACVGLSEDQRQQAIRIAEHASTGAD